MPQQLPGSQYRIQFGVKGWAAVAVGLTAFIAVAAALAIGFVFIALPVIALAPLIYWFMPKRKISAMINPGATAVKNDANGSPPGTIIDATFREIDPKQ
jgi:hypothetical protein